MSCLENNCDDWGLSDDLIDGWARYRSHPSRVPWHLRSQSPSRSMSRGGSTPRCSPVGLDGRLAPERRLPAWHRRALTSSRRRASPQAAAAAQSTGSGRTACPTRPATNGATSTGSPARIRRGRSSTSRGPTGTPSCGRRSSGRRRRDCSTSRRSTRSSPTGRGGAGLHACARCSQPGGRWPRRRGMRTSAASSRRRLLPLIAAAGLPHPRVNAPVQHRRAHPRGRPPLGARAPRRRGRQPPSPRHRGRLRARPPTDPRTDRRPTIASSASPGAKPNTKPPPSSRPCARSSNAAVRREPAVHDRRGEARPDLAHLTCN